jgi:hypothetical protein
MNEERPEVWYIKATYAPFYIFDCFRFWVTGVRVTRSLVFSVMFCTSLSVLLWFSFFVHCVVCSSSLYGLWCIKCIPITMEFNATFKIFQLYRSRPSYLWRKPDNPDIPTGLPQVTNKLYCIMLCDFPLFALMLSDLLRYWDYEVSN